MRKLVFNKKFLAAVGIVLAVGGCFFVKGRMNTKAADDSIFVQNMSVQYKQCEGTSKEILEEDIDEHISEEIMALEEKGHTYGSIINVDSIAGLNGGGGAAYVASKAAGLGITKHTAMRCAKDGVRCNAICPGMIKTPMTAGQTMDSMDPDMMGAMAVHSDLRLPACSAEDVANSILFLASDESAPVTGQCIVLDYGANL